MVRQRSLGHLWRLNGAVVRTDSRSDLRVGQPLAQHLWLPAASSCSRKSAGRALPSGRLAAEGWRLHTLGEVDPIADRPRRGGLRSRLHRIIFGVRTPAGRAFDVALLVAILLSVTCVLLESVPEINEAYGLPLRIAEWCFTVIFTVEYVLRLWTVAHARSYAFSFLGIIDLLAILPTYLSAFFSGTQSLAVVRGIRLLRVFRVFKLVRFVREGSQLASALYASRRKITVFVSGVVCIAVVFGTVMYLVEGDQSGFTSIPTSIYWAIVTLTTVGYGDVAPSTALGRLLSGILMILGYSMIVVPTGIVSAEMARADISLDRGRACASCGATGHALDARYCRVCGDEL